MFLTLQFYTTEGQHCLAVSYGYAYKMEIHRLSDGFNVRTLDFPRNPDKIGPGPMIKVYLSCLSTAKLGDNVFGNIHPSACLFVRLCVLYWLKYLTFGQQPPLPV